MRRRVRSRGRFRPVVPSGPGPVCAATAVVLTLGTRTLCAAADVIVSPAQVDQRIDGFGASSAFTDGDMDDTNADLAFSMDAGAGLSLLRIHIAPPSDVTQSQESSSYELATALQAQKRGARVWAAPWTPPTAWKLKTDDAGNGGFLDPQYYDAWAGSLARFVRTAQDAGVKLIALSAQNEPTTAASYESCTYDASAIADFVGNHLGPALDDAGVSASGELPLKVLAPETQDGKAFATFEPTMMASHAANYVGVFATHSYGGSPTAYPDIAAKGTPLWETEYSNQGSNGDNSMGNAISLAQLIRVTLVEANVNAWHFWWFYPNQSATDNSGLWYYVPSSTNSTTLTRVPSKRLFVLGNYSRFVRPGFYRIDAAVPPSNAPGGAQSPFVTVSAFCDAQQCDPSASPPHQVVVVAINATPPPSPDAGPDAGDGSVQQTIRFDGATTGAWQAWITSPSPTDDLAPMAVTIPDGSEITVALPAQSVVTLRGVLTGTGPSVTIDAGASGSSGANNLDPNDAAGCGLACSTIGRSSSEMAGRWSVATAAILAWLGATRSRRRRRGLPRDAQRGGPGGTGGI